MLFNIKLPQAWVSWFNLPTHRGKPRGWNLCQDTYLDQQLVMGSLPLSSPGKVCGPSQGRDGCHRALHQSYRGCLKTQTGPALIPRFPPKARVSRVHCTRASENKAKRSTWGSRDKGVVQRTFPGGPGHSGSSPKMLCCLIRLLLKH